MWGGIVGLIIQLISGAVGGNIAGALLKQFNLGAIGNTIAGVIGGAGLAQIVGAFVTGDASMPAAGTPEVAASGLDIGAIISQIIAGGAGGGVLMVIVGAIRQALMGPRTTS